MGNFCYTCPINLNDMGKHSKYHGVSKFRRGVGAKAQVNATEDSPWYARIKHNGGVWWSKKLATEREAAIAYDRKVLELGLDKPLNILKPKPRE